MWEVQEGCSRDFHVQEGCSPGFPRMWAIEERYFSLVSMYVSHRGGVLLKIFHGVWMGEV